MSLVRQRAEFYYNKKLSTGVILDRYMGIIYDKVGNERLDHYVNFYVILTDEENVTHIPCCDVTKVLDYFKPNKN